MVDGAQHVCSRNLFCVAPPLLERFLGLVGDILEVGGVLGQEDTSEEGEGIGNETPQIRALGGEGRNEPERGGGVLVGYRLGKGAERLAVGQPQGPGDAFGVDRPVAEGGDLLQETQRVADGPGGVRRHHGQALVPGFEALPGRDRGGVFDEQLGGDRVEIESLRPAPDRVEQLVRLGRCQNEDNMLRWLFEGLEQRIAGGSREHVRLVQDVDAARPGSGRNRSHIHPYLPYVLDLVVGGGVELDHIEGRAVSDLAARVAGVAGLAVGPEVGAVEGLGDEAGDGRLAGAARAGE